MKETLGFEDEKLSLIQVILQSVWTFLEVDFLSFIDVDKKFSGFF